MCVCLNLRCHLPVSCGPSPALRTPVGCCCSEYKYIHLTNYCQQKHAPSFEKFEAGNTLSFADFDAYLESSVPKGKGALHDVIMPQIKRFICDTFLALQGGGGRCGCAAAVQALCVGSCVLVAVWVVCA